MLILFAKISIILLIVHSHILAQIDTISSHKTPFHKTQAFKMLAVPSLLIGYGLTTLDDRGVYSSEEAQQVITNHFPGFSTHVDDYLRYAPAYTVYGLNLVGIKGKHNFVDRSLILWTSLEISKLTFRHIKRRTNRLRPDQSDRYSMPSGHTAFAFVTATFMHEEYKHISPWYSVAAYSAAVSTGLIRMLNNKHWQSDVFVGAGIGIFYTELMYTVYPYFKKHVLNNIFGNKIENMVVFPVCYSDEISLAVNISLNDNKLFKFASSKSKRKPFR